MNNALKLVIGIGVFFALLLILVLISALSANHEYRLDRSYEDSFRSDYEYNIMIGSHNTLHNVTLYLPVPMFENEYKVANEIIAINDWNSPSNWKYSLVDTEHGKMLRISAKEIKAEFHSYAVAIDHEINTKYPIGNESVLVPKYDMKGPYYKFPHTQEDRTSPLVYEYEGRIYADYETSPDNEVVISIELTGLNQWWTLGGSGNEYRDLVTINLTGEQDGWIDAKGKMITGDGVYN